MSLQKKLIIGLRAKIMFKDLKLTQEDRLLLKLACLSKSERNAVLNGLNGSQRTYIKNHIADLKKRNFFKKYNVEELTVLLSELGCNENSSGELPIISSEEGWSNSQKERYVRSLTRSEAAFLSVYSGIGWIKELSITQHKLNHAELKSLLTNSLASEAVTHALRSIVSECMPSGD